MDDGIRTAVADGDSRAALRDAHGAPEPILVRGLVAAAALDPALRAGISTRAAGLVRTIRGAGRQSLMEDFLAEYGLSSAEGVGLMCLAEALLRVPDARTVDELIRDKVEASDWGAHVGGSSSPLVNASTWALLLTGRLLDDADQGGPVGALRGAVRRLGEPVVRVAVAQAMKRLGRQFVLGQTIEEALEHSRGHVAHGLAFSYDMLGEAARTEPDAQRYQRAYADAIAAIAPGCGADIRRNPGISVKLSALHPRYEPLQRERVLGELVPRLLELARAARASNMGLTVDAEEAERLELSLDVIEAVLADRSLAGWSGFGVVVQAYGKRALPLIDWLDELARRLDRRLMVRLVKGAYWDGEVKRSQELGLGGFPVFTRKAHTDVSYLACARRLLAMTDRIYPQFATHNAYTCAAVLAMAQDRDAFEFQRLHGMGEALHRHLMAEEGTRCRVYAPVGAHRDLLAYLVRRLLENGANSSFVNQVADERVAPEVIAADPFEAVAASGGAPHPALRAPLALFEPVRRNSRGYDIGHPADLDELADGIRPFREYRWQASASIADAASPRPAPPASSGHVEVRNPADLSDVVGRVVPATEVDVVAAVAAAAAGFRDWSARPAEERAAALEAAADRYETHAGELHALCIREAGKTIRDAVAEVREAVDFLRYYASEARAGLCAAPGAPAPTGRGVLACISPWNFPLAIFTGQVAGALAAGNAVLAKPAEQTPLIAARAVTLLREAGVPAAAMQLLPGDGETVGAALTRASGIAGVLFTGSTEVARAIERTLAVHAAPDAVLVAETGGINAMVVDSTALPEQAVRDILASAFQSAGQRCSALRILYLQRDVAGPVLEMLCGAMDELRVGDPWSFDVDIGPVIDDAALGDLRDYCERMTAAGRLVKRLDAPPRGRFVAPHVFRVSGIEEVGREVFGPVLHVATFEADALDEVVDAINARGYGLTFAVHTRIDDRVQRVVDRIRAGNVYVNRNQIGAVVGSQPFGGEGLSGTGPKAGGPNYLRRLVRQAEEMPPVRAGEDATDVAGAVAAEAKVGTGRAEVREVPEETEESTVALRIRSAWSRLDAAAWARRPDRLEALRLPVVAHGGLPERALRAMAPFAGGPLAMPGPTGESNQLHYRARQAALCLGPDVDVALAQAAQALAIGGPALLLLDAGVDSGRLAVATRWREAGAPVNVLPLQGALLDLRWLATLPGLGLVAFAGRCGTARAIRIACSRRQGEIVPLVTEVVAPWRYLVERHLCIDTTAAGGNASLLAASS